MNITELRYLAAISRYGSVSAASKHLYVAQPNISKALKNLEEEYNLHIFDRTPTGMLPTAAGQRFIAQAARILDEVDRLEAARPSHTSQCLLRAAIPCTAYASAAVQDFLAQTAQAGRIRLHFQACAAQEALTAVLHGGFHISLLRVPAQDYPSLCATCTDSGLQLDPVLDYDPALLIRRDSPLAALPLSAAVLDPYTELCVLSSALPAPAGPAPAPPAPPPRRQVTLTSLSSCLDALCQLPDAYMWSAPVPQRLLDQYHLLLRAFPGRSRPMRDVLAWMDKPPLSPEASLFAQLVRQQAARAVR